MRACIGVTVVASLACGRIGFSPVENRFDELDGAVDATRDGEVDGTAATRLACGDNHTCVIDGAGRLACTGGNGHGELGVGDRMERTTLAPVGTRTDWVDVAAGEGTCGRHADGSVECWGIDERGQTGTGSATGADVLAPAAVALARPATVLSARFDTPCAVLDDGTLWCWGSNSEGELARGAPGLDTDPAFVTAPVNIALPAAAADAVAGLGHTCAVTAGGELYCWGGNTERELGNANVTASQVRSPRLQPDGAIWARVVAAQSHTLAIATTGALLAFGDDGRSDDHAGPLGLPGDTTDHLPEAVPIPADIVAISTMMFHSCALRSGGELWCWGRNVEGQLGLGDFARHETPAVVRSGVREVCTGAFHTCARRDDGTVECTGKNVSGQLGTGDRDDAGSWRPMVGFGA